MKGITSENLVEDIKKAGNANACYVDDPEAFADRMANELKKGDILLTSGAGNVWKYGGQNRGADWMNDATQNRDLDILDNYPMRKIPVYKSRGRGKAPGVSAEHGELS